MSATRTAVVTGAASGIGRALATQLAADDYHLALVDVDRRGLDDIVAVTGAANSAVFDVADPDAFGQLAERTGPVDVLCLNAGVIGSTMGAPWEAPPDEWRHVVGTNLMGVVNGLRAFVPRIRRQADRSGRILITASLAGAATWPSGGAYAASKHAVVAVAEQASMVLADEGITVTVLCPSLVRTAMSDEGADPETVAATALAAADRGQFAVLEPEWADAVRVRAEMLTTGGRPRPPEPS